MSDICDVCGVSVAPARCEVCGQVEDAGCFQCGGPLPRNTVYCTCLPSITEGEVLRDGLWREE